MTVSGIALNYSAENQKSRNENNHVPTTRLKTVQNYYSTFIASVGHTSTHEPQSVQISGSIL